MLADMGHFPLQYLLADNKCYYESGKVKKDNSFFSLRQKVPKALADFLDLCVPLTSMSIHACLSCRNIAVPLAK